MARVFEHTFTVGDEAVDGNGHVNNVEYVRWMQDAAVRHSTEQGWAHERYAAVGATWVARSHFIEYLKPAFAGDEVTVLTWVSDFRRIRSLRKYRMVRHSDGALLARAETDWVFMDAGTGRPVSVPPDVRGAFETVPEAEEPGRGGRASRNPSPADGTP